MKAVSLAAAASRSASMARVVTRYLSHQFSDRKSTRLNSSHANISYAVFCLKKKKTKTPPTSDSYNASPPTYSVLMTPDPNTRHNNNIPALLPHKITIHELTPSLFHPALLLH